MASEAPPFWWQETGWRAMALAPVGWLYGEVARRRLDNWRREALPVPVICVGNPTVGGAGKTPTAIALARSALAAGLKPGFLSRGHGGSIDRTTMVEPSRHRARDVGDEPLLLAGLAPTVIARKRAKGARRLIEAGCDLIIMDDGFQSASLVFDYALLVVDGRRGLGNGKLIPAGPVRAPLGAQLRHASALLAVGDGSAADRMIRLAARAGKAVHTACLRPREGEALRGRRVLAFAGIGDPDKFFRTLEECGATLVERRRFADHHLFLSEEIDDLLDGADRGDLLPVTTEKDMARLRGGPGRSMELAERAAVLEVDMIFSEVNTPAAILDAAMAHFRRRTTGAA